MVLKGRLLRSDGKTGRWAASASDKARRNVSDSREQRAGDEAWEAGYCETSVNASPPERLCVHRC